MKNVYSQNAFNWLKYNRIPQKGEKNRFNYIRSTIKHALSEHCCSSISCSSKQNEHQITILVQLVLKKSQLVFINYHL